jgi:hypothetical protein
MRKPSKDIWILACLLVLLVVIGILSSKNGQGDSEIEVMPRRTTYSPRPGGVKALYDTLDKLGYRVERHLDRLTTPPNDGVLFLVALESSPSKDEWQAAREWVERGNLLIVAGDELPENVLTNDDLKAQSSTPSCPSFLSPGVKSFCVGEKGRIDEDQLPFCDLQSFTKEYG